MRTLVSLQAVTKSFGATRALDGVSFDVAEGEVHALVGENGAGKSTLMNILAGVLRPDGGQMLIGDRPQDFRSPLDARAAGIATVFQELSLVDGLSVEENICAGRAPSRFGLIDRAAQRLAATRAMDHLALRVSPQLLVGQLTASQRQGVEAAKALHRLLDGWTQGTRASRLLILDEPTSALSAEEKTALFTAVRDLRSLGVGIIYISHHLDEVLALADRITVLRDGKTIWTRPAAGLDSDVLVRAMVGRQVERGQRARGTAAAVAASFENVGRRGQLQGLSFALHHGEILAVAGLDGSGRETVARLLAGVDLPQSGRIVLGGQLHPGSLRGAMGRGVGYVPDDRKALGLFLALPIADNAVVTDLRRVSKWGVVRRSLVERGGTEVIARQGVKASGPRQPVGALSGGNQQKVLFGKWLRRKPSVLIVEEPTKGVDVGAKRDIHDQLVAEAKAGAAVLVVSSDLPEILEIADRILVLHRGRLMAVLEGAEATEEAVMALASGLATAAA